MEIKQQQKHLKDNFEWKRENEREYKRAYKKQGHYKWKLKNIKSKEYKKMHNK